MNLPRIRFSRPLFSPRFFIYFLFGLVILVLAVEGGYYFWVQKRLKRQQSKNPVIARQEGVFTYVNSPEGTVEKMILGTITEVDGNSLTIKTDNNKTVQVVFTGEGLLIANLTSGEPVEKMGTIADLLIGDEVRVADIYSETEEQIAAKFLAIVRGSNK